MDVTGCYVNLAVLIRLQSVRCLLSRVSLLQCVTWFPHVSLCARLSRATYAERIHRANKQGKNSRGGTCRIRSCSSVDKGTSNMLNGRNSIPGGGTRFFFTPKRSNRLWGPHSLHYNGFRRFFPPGYSGQGVKIITPLHLVPRWRMVKLSLPSPLHHHGGVLH
jgi:hypothetical protein